MAVDPRDPLGLGVRMAELGERWTWVAGAAALVVAGFGGLAAFGLTVGVLAAVQTAASGRRLERATRRIERISLAGAMADRLERLGRVQHAVIAIYTASSSAAIAHAQWKLDAIRLMQELGEALARVGGIELKACREVQRAFLDLMQTPGEAAQRAVHEAYELASRELNLEMVTSELMGANPFRAFEDLRPGDV